MRLVFFGDSFTFGWGAPDCHADFDNDVLIASPTAWPAQVAELLGCDYINMACPGGSNQEIFYHLRRYARQNDDFIVVQWSYDDRDFLLSERGIEKINPYITTKTVEQYYRLHCERDMQYRSDLIIEHAALLLSTSNHLMLANNWYNRDIDIYISGIEMDHCSDAWPDGHPGPETNKVWAALVAAMIKEGGH